MDAQSWLKAIVEKRFEHRFANIEVKANGHSAIFKVSADAAKVDGVRQTGSAITAQRLADALGWLLLTAKLYEERWRQAGLKIKPALCDVVKDTAVTHSKKVDNEIYIARPDYRKSSNALDLLFEHDNIVADVGKAWIIDPKCTAKRAVNHGWIVGHVGISWDQARRSFWHGVPVSPTTGIEGEYIIQNRGAAHNLHHEDYSQVMLFVDGECFVDGEKMRTADVYTDPELCCLVLPPGQLALAFSRQPGTDVFTLEDVKQAVAVLERNNVPPDGDGNYRFVTPIPDTEPGFMQFNGTWGERAVAFALSEKRKGVKEEPDGSNNGPRIKDYLEPCVRDGQPEAGKYLAKVGANWCAAFFWFCQSMVQGPDDTMPPYRCSGYESELDAQKAGTWRSAKLVREGKWEPAEGDAVLFKRGTEEWQRHVARFVRKVDAHTFETIDGNKGNTIKTPKYRYDDPLLLGFIELPRDAEDISVVLMEPITITPNQLDLVLDVDDQNDGEKAV